MEGGALVMTRQTFCVVLKGSEFRERINSKVLDCAAASVYKNCKRTIHICLVISNINIAVLDFD